MSFDLVVALQRLATCNKQDRVPKAVNHDLFVSMQAGEDAVVQARTAWLQLERLGKEVLAIERMVGFPQRDKRELQRAFKDSKLLMRDRVVWQSMGRQRSQLDNVEVLDAAKISPKSGSLNTDQNSQLVNALYKVRAGFGTDSCII